jgi:gamma-glutamyl-gamma-aminobutyrate hydrolase PuuD
MAVGWSETGDRIIEAIEAADPFRWVFGVQWHPENLVNLQDETGLAARRLFEGFLAAAR